MSRPIGLSTSVVAAVRTITGAPVTADSGTLTDAHFPLLPSDTTGGTIDCQGFSTIWVAAEFTGGSSQSVTLDPLVRDEGAADGARWKRTPPATYLLDGSGFVEVRVDGRKIYPRISAVVSTPTTVMLLAYPGQRLPGRAFL